MFKQSNYLLGLAVLASAGFAMADSGSVVFGSWVTPDYAQAAELRVERLFKLEASIVTAAVHGTDYYRVISEPLATSEARALVADAKTHGFGAWLLRHAALRSPGPPKPAPPAANPAPASIAIVTQAKPIDRTEPQIRQPSTTSTPKSTAPLIEPSVTATARATQRADSSELTKAPTQLKLEPRPGQPQVADNQAGDPIDVPLIAGVAIKIDGKLDEPVWRDVPAHDNMRVSEPDTGATPDYSTISRFLYTKKGLYVSAEMEQPQASLIDRLSARDQYINRDAFGITLDPSGTGLYGYWFEVNLGDSVLDGKVVPERSISAQWDGPWRGASARTDTGWSVEMFLPWSMMAMPQNQAQRKLGFWVKRRVAHVDETYSWPALPFTGPRFLSAFQSMTVPGVEPKQQFAIFPFASVTRDEIAKDDDTRIGFDFSYRPSSNLQVTGTVNPDFGAVESDNVVVNLTAFETFFPEKRLFFLEGNEVFITSPRSDINRFNSAPQGTGARATPLTFTPEPTTILNTRRIGGAAKHIDIPDDVDIANIEQSKPTDLLGAVKLTGQAGGLRYGMLAAFEDDVELRGTNEATGDPVKLMGEGRNFGVVRALYEQSGRGRGRKALGYMGTLVTLPETDSMVHGVDAHYLSPNGKWLYDGQYLLSDVDSEIGQGAYNDLTYIPRRGIIHRIALDYLDKDLDISDLGFIRRNDAISARYGVIRSKSRDLEYFRKVRNSLFFSTQWSVDGFGNRFGVFSNQTFMFPNRSEFKFTLNYFPERWDDRNSRGNGMFKVEDRWFTQFALGTDTAKRFSWSGALTAEQEELGGWTYGTDLGFTYKPNGRLSVDLDVRYKRRDGWLVYRSDRNFSTYSATDWQPALKTDFFFSARHQLRLTLQWAGIKARDQEFLAVPANDGPLIDRPGADGSEDFTLSRLTTQFRYRWEIGPLSDLFVVYTRGSNLPNQVNAEFDDLFTDAFDTPIIEFFVVKLRYRFGT